MCRCGASTRALSPNYTTFVAGWDIDTEIGTGTEMDLN